MRWLVTWLVRLHPRPWRRRYADEFLALMQEGEVSLGVVLDVLAGALDARLHPELGTAPATVGAGTPPAARSNRFDKFAPRSRVVLRLAGDEAEQLGQPVRPEHLLLALLREGQGVAAHILAERGVQADELRATILARTTSPGQPIPRGVGLTPDARRVIELSVAEARRLRHHYIGTEHLLLGLMADTQGLPASLLRERNVGDLSELRRHITRVLNEGGPHLRPPI